MFTASYQGKPLVSASYAAEALARHQLPITSDFRKANSFFNPRGQNPGRGWILMRRQHLASESGTRATGEAAIKADALDLDARGDLVLAIDGEELTLRNLLVCGDPLCLTPSLSGTDPDAIYLVELADHRWLVKNGLFQLPINAQYNVRAPAYGASGTAAERYYESSLSAGSVWTWQGMVSSIYATMSSLIPGDATLPYTPDGTPEDFVFVGVPAWDALGQVLARLDCSVAMDLTSDSPFSIVRNGHGSLPSPGGCQTHDGRHLDVVAGKAPAVVRVFFHRRHLHAGTEQTAARTASQWQTQAAHSVDVAGPHGASIPGTTAYLWDDLPALYDETGALANGAALAARAAQRADNYYARVMDGPLWWIYSGLKAITPSGRVSGVSWRQWPRSYGGVQGGVTTEIVTRQDELCVRDDASFGGSPPYFGPTHPVYPEKTEVIQIESGSPTGGVYDATVQLVDPTVPASADSFAIWAWDLAGAPSLAAADRYLGRLVGYYDNGGVGRPLYAMRSGGGGGGSRSPSRKWTARPP